MTEIDSIFHDVVTRVDIGLGPYRPVLIDDLMWVSNAGDRTVTVLNPNTRSVMEVVDVGRRPYWGLEVGRDFWVPNFGPNCVSTIDSASLHVVDTITVVDRPSPIAVTGNRVPGPLILILSA